MNVKNGMKTNWRTNTEQSWIFTYEKKTTRKKKASQKKSREINSEINVGTNLESV